MRTVSSSSRRALLGRSKPFLAAAGPVAVFEASSARFGVVGARFSARRYGEVFLGARRRGHVARGRVAKFSSERVGVGEGAKRGEVCSRAM